MRIGINISPSAGGGRLATLDQIVDQVASFATQGFATAAFANIFGYDALTVIAVAGRAVPRIELETAVVPVFTRHPVAMAQQAVTTQAASTSNAPSRSTEQPGSQGRITGAVSRNPAGDPTPDPVTSGETTAPLSVRRFSAGSSRRFAASAIRSSRTCAAAFWIAVPLSCIEWLPEV